jgi:hypothetical protein
MKTIGRTGLITLSILAVLVLFGGTCVATSNKLVGLENTYQRRADLVPNLLGSAYVRRVAPRARRGRWRGRDLRAHR